MPGSGVLVDFGDAPEEAAFRARLRDWLRDNNPGLPASSTSDEYWAGQAAWHHALYDAGFFAMSWPTAIGGHGLPTVYEVILDEELAAAGARRGPASATSSRGSSSTGARTCRRGSCRGS
jgi:alkylation response protein AidB-like acyl-CoA dehydrogenase